MAGNSEAQVLLVLVYIDHDSAQQMHSPPGTHWLLHMRYKCVDEGGQYCQVMKVGERRLLTLNELL